MSTAFANLGRETDSSHEWRRKAGEPDLLQRAAAGPDQLLAAAPAGHCACGGGCPRCASALNVSSSGDPLEVEAGHVADAVVSDATPSLISTASPRLQRCGDIHGSACPCHSAPPVVGQVLRSAGEPLDAQTRTTMESRFGRRFSDVRVHTDGLAGESAQAVNALAYTVGKNVVFGPGRYRPGTTDGQRLIAHELTHVVQQGAGMRPTIQRACGPGAIGSRPDCAETTEQAGGELFTFVANCDDFQAGNEERLRSLPSALDPGDAVDIHGYASEEGPEAFNWDLSCARAEKARDVLLSAGLTPTQVGGLFKHGPAAGPRSSRRSVVIEIRSMASITTPQPVAPPEPKPVIDPVRAEQVECVRRLGGCPGTRSAGIPTDEEMANYNTHCRTETGYTGPDLTPTSEECRFGPVMPPRPTSITVLDWGSDWNAFNVAGGLLTIGQIDVDGVRDMVDAIKADLDPPPQPECIGDLTIIGHGSPGSISVGSGTGWDPNKDIHGGTIDPSSPAYNPAMRATLNELTPLFCPSATVTLRGCNVGDGPVGAAFVQTLADLWGVRVRAHVGTVRAGGYWTTGDWTEASPSAAPAEP